MISWLFEIDSLRLSTKDVTWSSTSYSGFVIADSFSGITMRWDISGNGLIAPNEMEFDVSNTAGTYSVSNFDGKFCIIRLIEDGTNTRTWKFKIDRAISYYGKITCYCIDFLQEHLTGDYPNTKSQKEIWPSDDFDEEESYSDCVPVVLGTAYIPVKSVNTGTARWYILGESGPTYTVHEVMSPRSWPNSSTWTPPTYRMEGDVDSGYQLLQPIIADSDGDTIADSVGLWRSGDTFYDMLCKFSRNDTASLTNPADWTEYILEDFGVSSSDIDSVSFGAAATLYTSLTISFNGGGWWEKESRESVLSNILAQTDSFIKCTDKVELYQFDATPVETITDVLLLSFSPSKISKSTNDSGRVHWPESATSPSDVLNGKATVPTHNGGTETTTSSDILECRFLSGDSVAAQKAGILYFQKKFEQSQKINFSVTFQSLSSKSSISPGQVVTLNNTLYGGSNNVIITDMTINPDMKVDFSGVVLNYLEDWNDLSPTVISVVEDTSVGFEVVDRYVRLSTDGLIFHYGSDNLPSPDPQTITVIAAALNIDDSSFAFSTIPDVKSQTSSSKEFTLSTTDMGANDSVTVTVSCDNKTDSVTITKVFDGSGGDHGDPGDPGEDGEDGISSIAVLLSNPANVIPADGSGIVITGGYSGTGTTITLYEGTTSLTYDGVGTSNGAWKVTATGSSVTPGAITDSGTYATVGNASSMTSDKAYITFTITGKRASGDAISVSVRQNFVKAKYGSRAGGIFTFEESTAPYITATDAGYFTGTTLTDTTAAQNVARDVIAASDDGYIRPNDRITVTDNSASKAGTRIYVGSGTNSYSSVSYSDYSSLVVETFDGSVIVTGTLSADKLAANTTLVNNLNVGSTMTLNSTGAIFTTGKASYTSTTAGFWMGYSSGYKINVGDSSNYLKWTGSSLEIAGSVTILNPATVRSTLNVADGADVTASNIAAGISGQGDLATQDSAIWSTQVTGTGKPANYADNTTTTINGGVITTGSIRNSANTMNINFSTATITINSANGLLISSSGGISFTTAIGAANIRPSGNNLAIVGRYIYSYNTESSYPGYFLIGAEDDSVSSKLQINYITGTYDSALYSNKQNWTYAGIFKGPVMAENVLPRSDNAYDVGSSTLRWDDIYATNGTINTSDAKNKENISASDLGLEFIKKLQPKKWVWSGKKRQHYGLVAQDIESVLQKEGIDFAGFVKTNLVKVNRKKSALTFDEEHSKSPPMEPTIIESSEIASDDEILESLDVYGLRYTEFIGPIIKAIQEIDDKLTLLKNKETAIK